MLRFRLRHTRPALSALAVVLAVAPAAAHAQPSAPGATVQTSLDLSGAYNYRWADAGLSSMLYPTGAPRTALGLTFELPRIQTVGGSYVDSWISKSADPSRTLSVAVGRSDVQTFHALVNTGYATYFETAATVRFDYADGSQLAWSLTSGRDVRDYSRRFTDLTYPQVAPGLRTREWGAWQAAGQGPVVWDVLSFDLSAHADRTLERVTITDVVDGQWWESPLVVTGMTIEQRASAPPTSVVPEPAPLGMLAAGGLAFGIVRGVRRRAHRLSAA
jgi:hypothetical protein